MTELFASSVDLMMVGMGTVFAFLTLMIFMTNLMSRLVMKYTPEVPDVLAPTATFPNMQNNAANDKQLISIINAAIKQHRNNSDK